LVETKKNKITVARLYSRYNGQLPTRAPIVLGIDRDKFRTICIYLKKSNDAENYFQQQGLNCYYISRQKFFRIFNVAAIWRLVKIFKQEKVDILHCHRHQATTYGTIAAKLAGVRVVFAHVHGLNRSKVPRRRFINSLVLKKVTSIFTVGQAVKKDVLAMNPSLKSEKIISIGNSIDTSQFLDTDVSPQHVREKMELKPDALIFGTVGRLMPTKGYSYLVDAFVNVKKQVPHAELVFVGAGRCSAEIKEQVKNCGLESSVHFLGQRDNVPEILYAFDIFVMSSIAEGIPRAMLEAMATGIPCIGTSAGGIPEILGDNEFGLVVPVADSDKLSEAMVHLAEDSQQRQTLADKAKQKIFEKYDHSVIVKKLENIYEMEYSKAEENI